MVLDVVIVNWNAGSALTNCVASVYAAQANHFRLGTVVVVDNDSTDGSLVELERCDRGPTKIVRNKANVGFGRGCNIGAATGSGDVVLFLNPDAVVGPQSLDVPMAHLTELRDSAVAICGVQLVDLTGKVARSCARCPTPWMFVVDALGLDRLTFGRLRTHVMTEWPHDVSRAVHHVIGAMYMIRRPVFDALGGFDERFFVYFEDLDLSCRANMAGWSTNYIATCQAFHEGGGTSKAVLDIRLFYSLHSRLLYSKKHFTGVGFIAVWLATLFLEPIVRCAALLFKGRPKDIGHVGRAFLLLYKSQVTGARPEALVNPK